MFKYFIVGFFNVIYVKKKMLELYIFFDIGLELDIENIKKNYDICFILL